MKCSFSTAVTLKADLVVIPGLSSRVVIVVEVLLNRHVKGRQHLELGVIPSLSGRVGVIVDIRSLS